MVLHQVGHDRLRKIRVGRAQESAEVLGVAHEIVDRRVLLALVVAGDADRVVDDEADVAAPQRQERLLGALAVHRADRFGDRHRVGVERARRRLELCLAPAECRVGRCAGEVDVLGKEVVEPRPQLRGLGARGHRHRRRHRAVRGRLRHRLRAPRQHHHADRSNPHQNLLVHRALLSGWSCRVRCLVSRRGFRRASRGDDRRNTDAVSSSPRDYG